MSLVDVVIPLGKRQELINACLFSLLKTNSGFGKYVSIILVNNFGLEEKSLTGGNDFIKVITPPSPLSGAFATALAWEQSTAPYILKLDDDTSFPDCAEGFIHRFLYLMERRFPGGETAMVGPIMPAASVEQSHEYFNHPIGGGACKVPILFTSCALFRKAAMPHWLTDIDNKGDDYNVCITLQEKGWHLVLDQRTFVNHHGGGNYREAMGEYYHSKQQADETQKALLDKFGEIILKKYIAGYNYAEGK